MRIVDDLGIPSLARGVEQGLRKPFGKTHISVTELIDSPRIRLLKQRHWDELERPLSQSLKAMTGTWIHALIEASTHGEGAIVEERLSIERQGKRLSGQVDLFEDGVVSDYKSTSVWSVTLPKSDRIKKWEQQTNIYAQLEREHGREVRAARIIAVFTDWSANKARQQPDYPRSAAMVIPIKLWTPGQTLDFIDARLRLHIDAEGRLPECSAEDRWSDDDSYAVMQNGRKSALRVLPSLAEAERWRAANGGSEIVKRTGDSRRCSMFCDVAKVCSQWAAMQAKREAGE